MLKWPRGSGLSLKEVSTNSGKKGPDGRLARYDTHRLASRTLTPHREIFVTPGTIPLPSCDAHRFLVFMNSDCSYERIAAHFFRKSAPIVSE